MQSDEYTRRMSRMNAWCKESVRTSAEIVEVSQRLLLRLRANLSKPIAAVAMSIDRDSAA